MEIIFSHKGNFFTNILVSMKRVPWKYSNMERCAHMPSRLNYRVECVFINIYEQLPGGHLTRPMTCN